MRLFGAALHMPIGARMRITFGTGATVFFFMMLGGAQVQAQSDAGRLLPADRARGDTTVGAALFERYARTLGIGPVSSVPTSTDAMLRSARASLAAMTARRRAAQVRQGAEAIARVPECPMPIIVADSTLMFAMRVTVADSADARVPESGRLIGCRNPLAP